MDIMRHLTPERKLAVLSGSGCLLWVTGVVATFVAGLVGERGGKYPLFFLLGYSLKVALYALGSALAVGFVLAGLIAVLNETSFFEPWPRHRLRAWTLQVILFTGITMGGFYWVISTR